MLRQLVLYRPEVADRLLELLALVGVLYSLGDAALHTAEAECPQLKATDVEYVKGDEVTFTDLAEYVGSRYFDILEEHLTGRRTLDAHFILLRTE